MDPKIIPFKEYIIEIHEHPIYHDFEFVVKKDGKVVGASTQQYQFPTDAEVNAKLLIGSFRSMI